jgi:Pin2-interacting protein X1
MSSQGWKPGEYLGAKDAPHAEFHTAANISHIRVTIKDDNLGLGAKIGSGVGHGECTGLDAFKNLLGRLNGKDEEELEKEQKSREDLKRAIYTEKRWGSIRFVQGGFLVGDKIQHLIDGEAERLRKLATGNADSPSDSSDSSDSDEEPEPVVEHPKRSKKRKLEEQEKAPEVAAVRSKKSKKERNLEALPEDVAEITATQEDVKASKKKSKRKREAEAEIEDEEKAMEAKKRKKEKRDKKDKKEKKKKSKSGRDEEPTKDWRKKSKRDKKKGDTELSESTDSTQATTKENTPSTPLETESGRSTPVMMQGRHAIRARNIAQKRLASMDVASLNQVSLLFSSLSSEVSNEPKIFMIKSQT